MAMVDTHATPPSHVADVLVSLLTLTLTLCPPGVGGAGGSGGFSVLRRGLAVELSEDPPRSRVRAAR